MRMIGFRIAKKQQGVVLIVALVLLLVLTVAGISAIRLANVEERMTGNFGDRNVAFQAAEGALRQAEQFIQDKNFPDDSFYNTCTGADCFEDGCTEGLCFSGSFAAGNDCLLTFPPSPSEEVFQKSDVWEDGSGQYKEITDGLDNVTTRYIIEFRCYAARDAATSSATLDANKYSRTLWEPMYRITAFSVGRSQSARVLLQSTFRRD